MVRHKQNWVTIKIVGIIFTSFTIFYLTYSGIKANLIHAYYLTTLVLQVTLTWESFLLFLRYLDRKIKWHESLNKRLSVQVIGGTFIILIAFTIIQFLIYPLDKLILNRHRLHGYWSFDIFICFLLAIIIQLIYTIYYFFIHWNVKENKVVKKEYISRVGNKQSVLSENEILGFYTENKIVFAITGKNSKHTLDLTLEAIDKQVNSNDFFRVNRQFILRKTSIKELKSEANNRLSIKTALDLEIPTPIIVSRKNTPSFRKWFNS